MKILFINSVVDYGSTGKIIRDLANGLNLEGHEVLIAYGRHTAKDSKNVFSVQDTLGMYSHVFFSRFFGRHGMHSSRATKKLINMIDSFKPDVINLHNLHGYYLNVPMLLQYLENYEGKILWTLHDTWLISGSSAYFDFNGCKVWNDGCVECNSTKDYPKSSFIKRQAKNFEWKKKSIVKLKNLSFITPSQWLKDVLATTYLKSNPCYVVNNGIDLNIFKENHNEEIEKQYEGKKVLLGVANKWEERKGLNDFIKLNDLLTDEFVIILIGLTPKEIANLPQGIIGITRTSNTEELANYYSLAHAFLNPTYEDNYPTTNLEALACNTPVIAYDTGGNKEVPGIEIVKQGDVLDLMNKIQNIDVNHHYPLDYFSKERFLKEMLILF